MKNKNELTVNQQKFVDEFLLSGNATDAYVKAGYKAKRGVAVTTASRLLTNAKVAAYLEKRREQLQKKVDVTQERVIERYAHIAFGDMSDVAEWGPDGVTLRDYKALPLASRRLVKKVKRGKEGVEIEVHDPQTALRALGEHLGILEGPGKNVHAPVQVNIMIQAYGPGGEIITRQIPVNGSAVAIPPPLNGKKNGRKNGRAA